jgi:hypothetical protein
MVYLEIKPLVLMPYYKTSKLIYHFSEEEKGMFNMAVRLDVDRPLWDQSTFTGRFKHFVWMTNPLSILSSTSQLNDVKTLVQEYSVGSEPPGTTNEQVPGVPEKTSR